MKLLILILFSWPVIFFAQSFDLRTKKYSENSSHLNAKEMIVTLDKGFAVVGSTDIFFGPSYIGGFVFYSDSSGNNHWEKIYTSFGDIFSFESIIQLPDSSFIAGGKMFNPITNRNGAALLKLDVQGNEQWKKSIDDSTGAEMSIVDLAVLTDSTFILVGTKTSIEDGSFIMLMDTAGNILWQKSYEVFGSNDLSFQAIHSLPNGNAFFSGGIQIGEKDFLGVLGCIDSIGNIIWSVQGSQPNSFYTDLVVDSNTIYCRNIKNASTNAISAFDYAGNLLWNYNFYDQEQNGPQPAGKRKIAFDLDSNLVAYSGNFSYSIFQQISRQGININQFSGFGMAQGIGFTSDNQCLVMLSGPAFGIKSNSIYNNHFAITRLDGNAPKQSSCLWEYNTIDNQSFEPTAPIELVESTVYSVFPAMMENVPLTPTIDQFCVDYLSGLSEEHIENALSPNPATDVISIILEPSLVAANDCIEMFDFTGKRLFQLPIYSSEMKLDVSRYSNGVYFIKIGQAGKKLILK
jgi:hypothetical protein